MCGVTGWVSYSQDLRLQRQVLQDMTDTMALRGPDAEGLWIDGPVGFGHRRLSVIDLEGGRQPMLAKGKTGQDAAVITYSGEVYNFQALRAELQSRGHRFETCSDTEVVLMAYLEWGEAFVDRLNGIYAFAIWNIRTRQLLLVRDRAGVKPLFYYQTRDGVIFGSEPKALLANPLVPRRVKADGLREILEMVKTPGHAIFEGMREVLPGEWVRVTQNGLTSQRYWQLQAREHEHSLSQTISHTRDLLEDIVGRQVVADVPLCSLLSGGLDSSIITALASKKLLQSGKGNIRSYSLEFRDHGQDFVANNFNLTPDAPFVRALIEQIHSTHEEVILDSALMADPQLHAKVVRALDLPPAFWGDMWPSLYRLFEEVRKHSTVALSGEAADELFGGYRWFHDPQAIAENTFGWMTSATGKYFDGKALLDPGLVKQLDIPTFLKDSYAQAVNEVPVLAGESAVNRRMRQETYVHLTRCMQIMLDRKDRMSMAVGLEVRVPFCDHRLVDYAFNIPWEMKTFDGREKSILRAAVKDLLPASILDRVKNPYPATQDPAYERQLRASMSQIANDPNAPAKPLLDSKRIQQVLNTDIGASSARQNRIGMEMAIGLNTWLGEYDVTLEL
jgi:asparagine synthase (glutamine-hydrolysing)